MSNVVKTRVDAWPWYAGVVDVGQSWVRQDGALARLQDVLDSLGADGSADAFDTIDLGHASDTTLSRSAPGRVAVEGVDLALDQFVQSGTGAVTRTVSNKLGDLSYSVLDYIPVAEHAGIRAGTSTTDLTSYIQAAVDHIETLTFSMPAEGRARLRFPAGRYTTGTITADKAMGFIGDGPGATVVQLKSGTTTSLFVLNAENVAGTTVDDAIPFFVCGMTLNGARVDSVTAGSSHGVYCPATGWTLTTQYSSSVNMYDVEIYNFTGDGIHLGANRNWAVIHNVNVRYCNTNGFASYSYDHRVTSSDFGGCTAYGIRLYSGGATSWVGCNVYSNLANVVINSFSNAYNSFVNCAFDFANEDGFIVSSATGTTSLIACRFFGNSASSAGTHSDIVASGASAKLKVIGCDFTYNSRLVAYLIELTSTPAVEWLANHIDTSTTPYATAITNDFSLISFNVGLPANAARFINSTDNANVQVARFEGDRATPTDNDTAYVSYMLSNDGGTQTEVARQAWTAIDVNAATSVDGKFLWYVNVAGTMTPVLGLQSGVLFPNSNDGLALGTTTLGLSDYYGASGHRFYFNNSVFWTSGAGTPEGNVTAPVGSFYTRSDGGAGTTLYIKESGSGNTGWVAK